MLPQIRSKFGEMLAWLGPTAKFLLVAAFFLALFVSILGWQTPFVRSAEMALFNLRYQTVMGVADIDERLVMIVYNEETALDTGRRSPVDRALLARALPVIDAMQPRAIAIDILFDSTTEGDEALLAALSGVQTPTYVAGVDPAFEPFADTRLAFLGSLTATLGGSNVSFADASLETDSDGVVRRWPVGEDRPLIADSVVRDGTPFDDYGGLIRYRAPMYADTAVFDKLPIDFFTDPEVALFMDALVRDRIVLIGVDYFDLDRFDVPFIDPATDTTTVSGIDIQAHMIAQRLDNIRYDDPPGWLAGLVVIFAIASAIVLGLFVHSKWLHIAGVIGVLAILLILPFGLQMIIPTPTYGFPAAGPVLGWALIILTLVTVRRSIAWERGRVAQFALARYLPPDIATEILARPSDAALSGDRRMIFTVFTDMEGFTDLCHRTDAGDVASLLNAYLETLSAVVIEHGGTIDKYVGDALVAIWGAPIAREDDGLRAYRAAIALQQAGEAFRTDPQWTDARVGRTRVGMHYGEAIVGNFGGKDRIQYTALGDTMNVAARLEAANKELGTKILVSDAAIDQLPGSQCRTMGSIFLRGRSTPVIVFEPVPDMDPEHFDRLEALHRRAMEGDPKAIAELRQLAPEDEALASFVERMGRIIEQREDTG
ncbi:adenylate/guanylate cyclase domain-containing protein [Parasphingopyxis sp.]|uniref:adenylate/guanylate cyclase domain-containing protein n=1 Tax=Parasphingopyxis sp. TaxID=1920299 RepID=UPI00260A6F0E|nr:adenylate/guanylate cyclase domain-containing protein [Parasphingopyxis sp.]